MAHQEMSMNIRLIGATALLASLAAAGCATTSPGYTEPAYGASMPSSSDTACYDCGTVTRIEVASTTSSNVPNATGAVLGGIVGAVAGREISDKTGGSAGNKNVATAAGAVAGAVAGNAIQNHAQAQGAYNVYVRMNDGRSTVVTQSDLGGIREGSYVRVTNGRAYLR
jgi:outer membrane lipoprotein SlyB